MRTVPKGQTSENEADLENTFRTFSNKFLKTTSIQVLDYICSTDTTKAERFFYLIAYVLLIALSSYYTVEMYTKWCNSPVLLTDASEGVSIAAFAFPAITICNLNQAKRSVAEKIERFSWDFMQLETLCRMNGVGWRNSTNATQWPAFREFILKTVQPCSEMLLFCQYGFVLENCTHIFQAHATDQGACCTFNMMHPDFIYTGDSKERILDKERNYSFRTPIKYSVECGYPEDLPDDFYPRRVVGTGVKMGFTVVLNASLNEYFCSSSRNAGFKILVHDSSQIPRVANSATLIPTKYETRIQINPSYRSTAKNVRKLSIKDRKCLYNSESTLKNFRLYTTGNCRLECIADIMEKECGCIQLYLPRRNNSQICGMNDILCANRVENGVASIVKPDGKCNNCLSSCEYIEYKVTVTRSRLVAKDPQLDEILPLGYDVNELAVVHFYHNQRRMRITRMETYLGFINFFSNSGGIYSLFLGLSFLSLIELCYFLVLLLSKSVRYVRKNQIADANTRTGP